MHLDLKRSQPPYASRKRYDGDMWLERLCGLIENADKLILAGGEREGVDFVFEALMTSKTLWLALDAPSAVSSVTQGNLLAETVNRALGSSFLPLALPYTFHVERLKAHQDLLEGYKVFVSNAQLAPGLAESLLSLNCQVVLGWQGDDPPTQICILPKTELVLTFTEASAEAPELPTDTLNNLYKITAGAYLEFHVGLSRLTTNPLPEVPHPSGATLRPIGQEVLADPKKVLDHLLAQGRLIEALEVACLNVPERVESFVGVAGASYQDRGLYEHLFLNLYSLDDRFQTEAVLEWLLVGAVGCSHLNDALPLVETYLDKHKANDLRARYVGLIKDPVRQLEMAEFLATLNPTPLTLFQWGRLHPKAERGVSILKESIRLAETSGRAYEVVRNSGALAEHLLYLGDFSASRTWSEWALRRFDQHDLNDGKRLLRLKNNWAVARMVMGETAGLREELWSLQGALETSLPEVALTYRQTLAELELVEGRVASAQKLAESCVWQASRRFLGQYVVTLVRTLIEQDALSEALHEAEQAYALTEHEPFGQGARLALGMALSALGDPAALPHLEAVMHSNEAAERRCAATLYYLASSGKNAASLPPELLTLFKDVRRSGLVMFSGPATRFQKVWAEVLGDNVPLRIVTLGKPGVYLHGEPVYLSSAKMELLVILALHRGDGLNVEQIQDLMARSGAKQNVRTAMSRLRQYVPISAAPYKLALPYSLDAYEVETLVAAGRFREALALYEGPFLNNSSLSKISDYRAFLEELLREAVLTSDDAEVLYSFAERFDDFEVWEKVSDLFEGLNDPRVAVARARIARLAAEFGDSMNDFQIV